MCASAPFRKQLQVAPGLIRGSRRVDPHDIRRAARVDVGKPHGGRRLLLGNAFDEQRRFELTLGGCQRHLDLLDANVNQIRPAITVQVGELPSCTPEVDNDAEGLDVAPQSCPDCHRVPSWFT